MTPPSSPRPPSYRPLPPPRDNEDPDSNPPAYPSRLSIPPPPYVRGPQPPLPPTPTAPDTPPRSADKDLPSLPAHWGAGPVPSESSAAAATGERPLQVSPEEPPSPLSAAFPPNERPLPPLPAPTQAIPVGVRQAINGARPLPPLPGSERPLPPPPPSQDRDADMTPLLPPLPGARERVPLLIGERRRKKSWQWELERARASFGLRGGKRAVSSG